MNKPLFAYSAYCFGFTWTYVIGLYILFEHGLITENELNIYYAAGAIGPFLAALITSKQYYNREGLRRFLYLFDIQKVSRKSLALSLSPLLFFIVGLIVYPLFAGREFSFEVTKQQFNLIESGSYLAWGLPFLTYAIFEEPGWRGFMLPHLQEKYTAFVSTIILTIVWGIWHAPFFLFRFTFSPGITAGFFFGLFVGAIILTSIFNLGHGTIWTAIIFHLTNNFASAFDKEYLVVVVSVGFIGLAIYLIWKYGLKHLSDSNRITFFSI